MKRKLILTTIFLTLFSVAALKIYDQFFVGRWYHVQDGGPENDPRQRDQPPERIACTMEAKQCPDGSYVGKVGPNCEFKACPE